MGIIAATALGLIAVVCMVMKGCPASQESESPSSSSSTPPKDTSPSPSNSSSSSSAPSSSSSSSSAPSSSVVEEIEIASSSSASDNPKETIEKKESKLPEEFIQNKTHWCWATAAIILANGQWCKQAQEDFEIYIKNEEQKEYYDELSTSWAENVGSGIREAAGYDGEREQYYCDDKQRFVVFVFKNTETDNSNGYALDAAEYLTGKKVIQRSFYKNTEPSEIDNQALAEIVTILNSGQTVIADAFTDENVGHSFRLTAITAEDKLDLDLLEEEIEWDKIQIAWKKIQLVDTMDGTKVETLYQNGSFDYFSSVALTQKCRLKYALYLGGEDENNTEP